MNEYLELISLNVWHIVATIANLLILTLIVKKFLFKPVQKIMAERKAQVENLYREAEESRDSAEKSKAEYEKKLETADETVEGIIRDASKRAEAAREEIIADANRKARETAEKAEREIAQEKKKAINELKNEISGISVEIAENVVGREIDENDHRELIDSFIEKL